MDPVTVIIPTFRDNDRLLLCLSALRSQTYPADRIHIVVADNTPDFELDRIRGSLAPAELVHEPRSGSYAARNRALSLADTGILAFTDSDCIPAPDWIENGVAELQKYGGRALIAGRIDVFPADTARPTAVEVFELSLAFPQENFVKGDHFGATANVFVSRQVIDAVGPFNAELKSGGDYEFGNRVHRGGFPVVYSDRTVIRHPARMSMAEILKKNRRVEKGVFDLERMGFTPKGTFRRGSIQALRPPLGVGWHILRRSPYGAWPARVRAVGVMLLWHYHRAACRLRLLQQGAGGG